MLHLQMSPDSGAVVDSQLKELNIFSLDKKTGRGDLIEVYKMQNGIDIL